MMTEPLRCPFCGAAPIIEPKNPEKEGNAWGRVRCISVTCQANPSVDDGEDTADERGTAAYQAAAIARWNRRFP